LVYCAEDPTKLANLITNNNEIKNWVGSLIELGKGILHQNQLTGNSTTIDLLSQNYIKIEKLITNLNIEIEQGLNSCNISQNLKNSGALEKLQEYDSKIIEEIRKL